MKKFLISVICALCMCSAFAAGENVATSKAFVDTAVALKQDKIPANVNGNNGPDQVLTNTGTAGTVGTKDIYSASGEYATQMGSLVDAQTMNAAVQNAINAEFKCVQYNPNDSSDCWLVDVLGQTETRSKNLFDISRVPNTGSIINNGDGSITVTGQPTNSAMSTGRKLSQLVPDLEVGKTYILSFVSEYINAKLTLIYSTGDWYHWNKDTSVTMTQHLLDSGAYFQAPTSGVPITMRDIQIEEGTVATPYQPYGANVYIPSND